MRYTTKIMGKSMTEEVAAYVANPLAEGRKLEHRVLELTKYLEGVKNAKLTNSGSAADCILKVDLVIYPVDEPKLCYGIQIKTTAEQAVEHAAKPAAEYRGQTFDMPPVLVEGSNYSMVKALSDLTQLPLVKEVATAELLIQTFRAAKATVMPYEAVPVKVRKVISELGLLKPTNGAYVL